MKTIIILFGCLALVPFLTAKSLEPLEDLSEEFDSSERQDANAEMEDEELESNNDEELEATDDETDESINDEEMENEEDESTEVGKTLVRERRQRCPTIRFPCRRMPNVCANMRNALRRGKPRQLNRITSRSQIRRNRRLSGCRRLGRRRGFNCDEYPFASSRQGGRGAVIRLVPARENFIQGALLGIFYRRRRIRNGGCFRVSLGR